MYYITLNRRIYDNFLYLVSRASGAQRNPKDIKNYLLELRKSTCEAKCYSKMIYRNIRNMDINRSDVLHTHVTYDLNILWDHCEKLEPWGIKGNRDLVLNITKISKIQNTIRKAHSSSSPEDREVFSSKHFKNLIAQLDKAINKVHNDIDTMLLDLGLR